MPDVPDSALFELNGEGSSVRSHHGFCCPDAAMGGAGGRLGSSSEDHEGCGGFNGP